MGTTTQVQEIARTPGPWTAHEQEPESSPLMVEGTIIKGPEGQLVAEILSADVGEDRSEQIATGDAALIAAAPDLLSAAIYAARKADPYSENYHRLTKAIARATKNDWDAIRRHLGGTP